MALTDPSDVPIPAELAVDEEPFDPALVDDFTDLSIDTLDDVTDGDRLAPIARFRIDDDGTAEWAMRHVAELDGELAVIAAQDAAWKAKIEDWRHRVSKHAEGRRRFFVAHLEDYQRRRREENPKAKTLALPSGKVTSTTTGGNAKVIDTDQVVAWFEEKFPDHVGDVVKVEESIKVAEFRKVVRVVDRQIGRAFEGVLSCGHGFYFAAVDEPGNDVPDEPAVGMAYPCPSCPIDVLDAAPPMVTITSVQSKPMMTRVVVDPDDEIIPGTAVEPDGLNVTVKPG